MERNRRLLVLAGLTAGLLLPSSASSAPALEVAVCHLKAKVQVAPTGKLIELEPAAAECVGRIADRTIDPAGVVGAIKGWVGGSATCRSSLSHGRFAIAPRVPLDFSPAGGLRIRSRWTGDSGAGDPTLISGRGTADGEPITVSGVGSFHPRSGCDAGTVRMNLVLTPA